MNVLVLSQGLSGAIPWYRLTQPLLHCKKHKLLDVDFLDSRIDMTPVSTKIQWADVIVIQCRTDWKTVALIHSINNTYPDKLVVGEYDDNICDIQPWNEKYVTLGQKEVKLDIDVNDTDMVDAYRKSCERQGLDFNIGKHKASAYLWKDGKLGFNLEENIDRMDACKATVHFVDLLTCTTKELASQWIGHAKRSGPTVAFPNLIDFDYWKPQKINDTGKLRICWQGGSSHYRDWQMCKDALIKLQNEYDFTLVIAGQRFKGITEKIKDVEVIPWHGDIRTYPLMMRNLKADIGIIPLEDNVFNRGKSALKWIEYSALKIPTVASNVTPYKQVINNGKTGILADNNTESWYNAIKRLIDDNVTVKQYNMLQLPNEDLLKMQTAERYGRKPILQEMSRRIHEELEKDTQSSFSAAEKRQLQVICECLPKAWKDKKETMRELLESSISNASPRLQQAIRDYMALQKVPPSSTQKERISLGETIADKALARVKRNHGVDRSVDLAEAYKDCLSHKRRQITKSKLGVSNIKA